MAYLKHITTVRYVDAAGRRVPKGSPGAVKVKRKSRKWYAAGPPLPPDKRVPLCADRKAAQAMLADLVRRIERGEAGLDDSVVRARRQPIAEHVADWRASLESADNDPKHVKDQLARVEAVVAALKWKSLADVDADRAVAHLTRLRRPEAPEGGGPAPRGMSARTCGAYLQALSQFCRWLAHPKRGRLAADPFAGVDRPDPKLDPRHKRHAFTPPQLVRLLEAVGSPDAPAWRGLAGRDRLHLYLTTFGTGLRANELAGLTPASFDLDGAPPAVSVAARRDKARRGVKQPLPPGLAAALRGYLAGRPAGERVWPGTWHKRAADMLKADLEAAALPYTTTDEDGVTRHADFHSLRHTYVTAMEGSGISPKEAQGLARHSDVRLTLEVYTHADRARLGAAAARIALPGMADPAAPQPLTRDQAAAAAAVAWATLAWLLVAPPVAPGSVTKRDETGGRRDGPETGGDAQGPEKPGLVTRWDDVGECPA